MAGPLPTTDEGQPRGFVVVGFFFCVHLHVCICCAVALCNLCAIACSCVVCMCVCIHDHRLVLCNKSQEPDGWQRLEICDITWLQWCVGRLVLQGDKGFIKGPASLSMTQTCSFACHRSHSLSLGAARLDSQCQHKRIPPSPTVNLAGVCCQHLSSWWPDVFDFDSIDILFAQSASR